METTGFSLSASTTLIFAETLSFLPFTVIPSAARTYSFSADVSIGKIPSSGTVTGSPFRV